MKKYFYLFFAVLFFACNSRNDITDEFLSEGIKQSYNNFLIENQEISFSIYTKSVENPQKYATYYSDVSKIIDDFNKIDEFVDKIEEKTITIDEKQELLNLIEHHYKLLDSVVLKNSLNLNLLDVIDCQCFYNKRDSEKFLRLILNRTAYADFVVLQKIKQQKIFKYDLITDTFVVVCTPEFEIVKKNDIIKAEIYWFAYDSNLDLTADINGKQYTGVGKVNVKTIVDNILNVFDGSLYIGKKEDSVVYTFNYKF